MSKRIDEDLKKRFVNTYKFCKPNFSNLILLRKGVYPYEYTDQFKNVSKTSLLENKDFYSSLNRGDITGP